MLLHSSLAEEYDADPPVIGAEVDRLIAELVQAKLLTAS
jgi:hypothetical protein